MLAQAILANRVWMLVGTIVPQAQVSLPHTGTSAASLLPWPTGDSSLSMWERGDGQAGGLERGGGGEGKLWLAQAGEREHAIHDRPTEWLHMLCVVTEYAAVALFCYCWSSTKWYYLQSYGRSNACIDALTIQCRTMVSIQANWVAAITLGRHRSNSAA